MIEGAKFLRIDEEGYLQSGEVRLTDSAYGSSVLSQLQRRTNGSYFFLDTSAGEIQIEAFDEPYVVRSVELRDQHLFAQMPYSFSIRIESLSVDEFDRFHGIAENGIPVVFSRSAQALLFDLCTEFDDDSITLGEQVIQIPPFFNENKAVSESQYWDHRYESGETSWDLNGPHPALVSTLPQLKLVRSRILVIGCGSGHDAAYLAQQGHIVTAIDFSAEAIAKAKQLYAHIPHLNFETADFFKYAESHAQSFDIVFEHTLFPAIPPDRRARYSASIKKLLIENGFLLAIFFATSSKSGPPFGSTEWEIQKRLSKDFQSLYWQRIKNSPSSRIGKELLIFARKKSH